MIYELELGIYTQMKVCSLQKLCFLKCSSVLANLYWWLKSTAETISDLFSS